MVAQGRRNRSQKVEHALESDEAHSREARNRFYETSRLEIRRCLTVFSVNAL